MDRRIAGGGDYGRQADLCGQGGLIFGAFAGGGHFDEPGVELGEGFDEVGLSGHDGVDVFIGHGDFVQAGRDESDALFLEVGVDVFPGELFGGLGAAHATTGAVRGGLKREGVAFTTDEEARGGHGTGDDAERAG